MPDGTLAISSFGSRVRQPEESLRFNRRSAEPADRARMLTVVAADAAERPSPADGKRMRSIALWFHLVSIGTVASATIAAFFGVAFVLLLQEAHGARSHDHAAAVTPSAALSALRQDRARPAPPTSLPAIAAALVKIPPAFAAPLKPDAYQLRLPEHAAEQAAADADQPQPSRIGMPDRPEAAPAPEPVAVAAMAAPSSPVAASPTPTNSAAPAGPPLPKAEVAELLERGDAFLRAGDVASARLFYERAADAGDGQAAMRIGATFDPAFLASVGLRGTLGDPAAAHAWYARARQPEPGKALR